MPSFAGSLYSNVTAPGARGGQCQKDLFWNGMHVKFTGDTGILAPMFIAEKSHIDEMISKLRLTLDGLA